MSESLTHAPVFEPASEHGAGHAASANSGPPADVVITVTSAGDIVCTPDPLLVSQKNMTLVFRLATPGYVFRDVDPIVVTQPGSAFPFPSKTQGGTTALLFDRDNSTASYSYCVYLLDQATGKVISVDPTIRNEPL